MSKQSLQSAMTAPLTPEQARERLEKVAEQLTCATALRPTLPVRAWTAQNIGKRRVEAMLDECHMLMWDQGAAILTALDVLTREPQARPSLWERLRTWAIGRPEQ
jgi:hypothetical protein